MRYRDSESCERSARGPLKQALRDSSLSAAGTINNQRERKRDMEENQSHLSDKCIRGGCENIIFTITWKFLILLFKWLTSYSLHYI